ncbi:MAG: tRNA lysidine(34) synthetase TilS [Methylobacteriaceae bacterium]|nr:tRNA lysidine(34) synthetase TilS [Methylobacteriaceae bacterium]
MSVASPLSGPELLELLETSGAPQGAGILGAVSGGPDSTVLLHALSLFRQRVPDLSVTIATVDHGWRNSSAAEAEAVGVAARALGLPHHVLTHRDPTTAKSEEAARTVRYALLTGLAGAVGAGVLMSAHTLDDQAETVWMRLARGSGLAGLAAMPPVRPLGSLLHVRPFLTVSKARLVATCRANRWPCVLDPANDDPAYCRTHWRRLAPELARRGLTAERTARFSQRCARADAALDLYADALEREATLDAGEDGRVVLNGDALASAPAETVLRVLIRAAGRAGGKACPRLERAEACAAAVTRALADGSGLKRTLSGAVLELKRGSRRVELYREPQRSRGMRRREPGESDGFSTSSLVKPVGNT